MLKILQKDHEMKFQEAQVLAQAAHYLNRLYLDDINKTWTGQKKLSRVNERGYLSWKTQKSCYPEERKWCTTHQYEYQNRPIMSNHHIINTTFGQIQLTGSLFWTCRNAEHSYQRNVKKTNLNQLKANNHSDEATSNLSSYPELWSFWS